MSALGASSCEGGFFWQGVGEMPWQQFLDAVDGMLGDAREHLAQVSFRIQAIELGRADKAVEGGGSLATSVGSRKEKILPSLSDTAQGAFCSVAMPRHQSQTS